MRGSDEYCPHCDNHFVLEAKIPKPHLEVEGEDVRIDSRYAPKSKDTSCKLTCWQNDKGRPCATGGTAHHLRCQGGTQQAGMSKGTSGPHNQTTYITTKRRAEQRHEAGGQCKELGSTCARYAIFCALAGGVCSIQSHKVYHVDAVQFMGAVNRNFSSMRLIPSPRHQRDASGWPPGLCRVFGQVSCLLPPLASLC
jgi:hypothetical protein